LKYEIKRQSQILDKGEPIVQETRGWYDDKQITFHNEIKKMLTNTATFQNQTCPLFILLLKKLRPLKAKCQNCQTIKLKDLRKNII